MLVSRLGFIFEPDLEKNKSNNPAGIDIETHFHAETYFIRNIC